MSDTRKVVTLLGNDDLEAEAASWLTVLGRENLSKDELADFNQWLNQSVGHRAAFDEISGLWDDLAILKDLDDIAEAVIAMPEPRKSIWLRRPFLSMAASLVIGVAVAGLFYVQYLNGLTQRDEFVTLIGEQRTVHLSDDSTIQLNTDSHVEIDFSVDKRAIRLLRGEAHFDVAKHKQRPFYVYAGSGVVRAVGTAFTVRLMLRDEVEVTVEEGRVSLSSLQPTGATNAQVRNLTRRQFLTELTAGQSTVFGKQVEQISQMQPPELSRKLAWRQGMLAYAGDRLIDVVEDVSRYTDITIEISDPVLRNLPIAGYFKVGEVEALFDSLELTFGLDVERINDKYVRLSSSL